MPLLARTGSSCLQVFSRLEIRPYAGMPGAGPSGRSCGTRPAMMVTACCKVRGIVAGIRAGNSRPGIAAVARIARRSRYRPGLLRFTGYERRPRCVARPNPTPLAGQEAPCRFGSRGGALDWEMGKHAHRQPAAKGFGPVAAVPRPDRLVHPPPWVATRLRQSRRAYLSGGPIYGAQVVSRSRQRVRLIARH
jgi:hypothetical protein